MERAFAEWRLVEVKMNNNIDTFSQILTEMIINLREFPGRLSNKEIDDRIDSLLHKSAVNSIERGRVQFGEKAAHVLIVNYKDQSKVIFINGNLWKDREEDYGIIYQVSGDNFWRMEQSGSFDDYSGQRNIEDLLDHLKKCGFEPEIIENPNKAEEIKEQLPDFTSAPDLKSNIFSDQIF